MGTSITFPQMIRMFTFPHGRSEMRNGCGS
jgi:hypothetical protein